MIDVLALERLLSHKGQSALGVIILDVVAVQPKRRVGVLGVNVGTPRKDLVQRELALLRLIGIPDREVRISNIVDLVRGLLEFAFGREVPARLTNNAIDDLAHTVLNATSLGIIGRELIIARQSVAIGIVPVLADAERPVVAVLLKAVRPGHSSLAVKDLLTRVGLTRIRAGHGIVLCLRSIHSQCKARPRQSSAIGPVAVSSVRTRKQAALHVDRNRRQVVFGVTDRDVLPQLLTRDRYRAVDMEIERRVLTVNELLVVVCKEAIGKRRNLVICLIPRAGVLCIGILRNRIVIIVVERALGVIQDIHIHTRVIDVLSAVAVVLGKVLERGVLGKVTLGVVAQAIGWVGRHPLKVAVVLGRRNRRERDYGISFAICNDIAVIVIRISRTIQHQLNVRALVEDVLDVVVKPLGMERHVLGARTLVSKRILELVFLMPGRTEVCARKSADGSIVTGIDDILLDLPINDSAGKIVLRKSHDGEEG